MDNGMDEKMNESEEKTSDTKKKADGLSIGIEEIDDRLQGLQKSELIVLVGRPSVGKTTLAVDMVRNIVLGRNKQAPRPVAIFSLEMKATMLMDYMIVRLMPECEKTPVGGNVAVGEHRAFRAAADALRRAPIYVEDAAFGVKEIRDRARQLKEEFGIEFIVVDYLQLVRGAESQHDSVSICRELKGMAKELNIPVLGVSHLCRMSNANNDGPRLTNGLSPLPGILQEADIVMLLQGPS